MARRQAFSVAFLAAVWFTQPALATGPVGERDGDGRIQEVARQAIPRVVKILGAGGIRGLPGSASGTIISPEGHILTQDSILLSARNLRVVLHDGRILPAKVLRRDRARSVALIKVDVEEPLPSFGTKDPGPFRIGQWVLSIANSFELAKLDEPPGVNLGVLSSVTRLDLRLGVGDFPYRGRVIVTDANNNPGGFGGALVDLRGRLIGINGRIVESKDTNTQISYAIPIQDLMPLIDGSIILEREEMGPEIAGRHGIRLFDLGTRKSPPAYVAGVQKGSPGAAAGLRRDDLIIRCGQASVRSCKEFYDVIGQFGPGDEVPITFKRQSKILHVRLRLGDPEPETQGKGREL